MSRPSVRPVDLAVSAALTETFSLQSRCVDEVGALRSDRVVCPRPSITTTTPSDCLSAAGHFPGITGYRPTHSLGRRPTGRGGSLQFPRQPSDRSTPTTPEGSSPPAPGSLAASMAFALPSQARHPLGPPHGGFGNDAHRLRFMLRTGQSLAPSQGLRRSAFDNGISAAAGSRATRDPGVSPDRTHTGWLS